MFLVLLAPIVLTNCTKESEVKPVTNPVQIANTGIISKGNSKSLDGSLRIFLGNRCSGTGGSCLPDFIVYGKILSNLNKVFAVIKMGNDDNIKTVFQENAQVLSENISEKDIEGVVNGTLKATFIENSETKTKFIILKEKESNKEVSVYPYVDEI